MGNLNIEKTIMEAVNSIMTELGGYMSYDDMDKEVDTVVQTIIFHATYYAKAMGEVMKGYKAVLDKLEASEA